MKDFSGYNATFYEDVYRDGYGIQYPESHVIRAYEAFIKHALPQSGSPPRVLDFGCGIGTHSQYFFSKGLEVCGVDVSESAILKAKDADPAHADRYIRIDPAMDFRTVLPSTFDLIFANQVLYYLDDTHLRVTLQWFDNLLAEGGVVFFTMMSTRNHHFNFVKAAFPGGIHLVELDGRLTWRSYINFTESEAHLKERFSLFEPIAVGYYDASLTGTDSGHHFTFIGRKRPQSVAL